MKILFLIRSLNIGGAERQLVLLAHGLQQRGHAVSIATFYAEGALAQEVRALRIRLLQLDKSGRWDILSFAISLFRIVRSEAPDILHSYLTVANVIVALMQPLTRVRRLVWGIRASGIDASKYDWFVALTNLMERWLATVPDLIIFNSEVARDQAVHAGYPERLSHVVHNGIDTVRFVRDDIAGRKVRGDWGIGEGEVLVGMVARIDPMKGHEVFIEAAARLGGQQREVRFVIIGEGDEGYRRSLLALARKMGVVDRLVWAGSRNDLRAVYSALDVFCMASVFGEGFPNAVGEAMACELPCVVTDVGDARVLVGDAGQVVPPGDPVALAAALSVVVNMGRSRSLQMRERVSVRFSVDSLIVRTERLLAEIV